MPKCYLDVSFFEHYVKWFLNFAMSCFSAAENRGGGHRGTRGGGGGRQQNSTTLRFDGEFDFEQSNAQFDKVQIEREIEKELKEKLALGTV